MAGQTASWCPLRRTTATCGSFWRRTARQAARLGAACEERCLTLRQQSAEPEAFAVLTGREREVALLAAARMSNREIAEKLYLSEGSVKQYVNRIYAKLFIEGDTRTKRKRLADMVRH